MRMHSSESSLLCAYFFVIIITVRYKLNGQYDWKAFVLIFFYILNSKGNRVRVIWMLHRLVPQIVKMKYYQIAHKKKTLQFNWHSAHYLNECCRFSFSATDCKGATRDGRGRRCFAALCSRRITSALRHSPRSDDCGCHGTVMSTWRARLKGREARTKLHCVQNVLQLRKPLNISCWIVRQLAPEAQKKFIDIILILCIVGILATITFYVLLWNYALS